MKPVPIQINASTRQQVRIAFIYHQREDFWVGSGFVDKRRSTSPRRFLRARNEDGICTYFYWTEPKRGQQVPNVFAFKKRVKISLEQAREHYKK